MTRRLPIAHLAIAGIALASGCTHATAPAQATSPNVALARAAYGNIDVTVPAVGRLGASAGAQTKLAFATSGRIGSVIVHVGERVNAGDALAALDAAPLALTAQAASADAQAAAVDRTTTRLAVDRAALVRANHLFAAGVVARKEVEAAHAQVALDRADRATADADAAAARARAALAERDLSNATLRSPIAGVVTAIYRQVGESVDPTIAVVSIAPGTNSEVVLDLAGTDAARVAAGDLVRIRVSGVAGVIDGSVAGVAGAVDPNTQSAQVVAHAAVPQALAGAAVSADIVVAHDRGILIPKDAIVADPASGKTLVFVQSKSGNGSVTFNERDVRVVFANEKLAEVTGLRAGENIAATGAFELLPPPGGG
ncbi:MAG TPA: efflux RND transporter periplasmic adaptor subunit [Candidatus Baltobacteraceae bacterium]|nr:efflux RND transporter periplasmic adaptor subunit [Candidatus Baltobacteraceae bacterium]